MMAPEAKDVDSLAALAAALVRMENAVDRQLDKLREKVDFLHRLICEADAGIQFQVRSRLDALELQLQQMGADIVGKVTGPAADTRGDFDALNAKVQTVNPPLVPPNGQRGPHLLKTGDHRHGNQEQWWWEPEAGKWLVLDEDGWTAFSPERMRDDGWTYVERVSYLED